MGQDPFTDSGKIHPILAKQLPRNSGILARHRRSLYEIRASGSSRNLYAIRLVAHLSVNFVSENFLVGQSFDPWACYFFLHFVAC